MKDYLGNILEIGDEVAFILPGYREFTRGVITKFTRCFVMIDRNVDLSGRPASPASWVRSIKQTPDQLIQIPKP
jgi:hypothetical protein